jgi:hypothetical protein
VRRSLLRLRPPLLNGISGLGRGYGATISSTYNLLRLSLRCRQIAGHGTGPGTTPLAGSVVRAHWVANRWARYEP